MHLCFQVSVFGIKKFKLAYCDKFTLLSSTLRVRGLIFYIINTGGVCRVEWCFYSRPLALEQAYRHLSVLWKEALLLTRKLILLRRRKCIFVSGVLFLLHSLAIQNGHQNCDSVSLTSEEDQTHQFPPSVYCHFYEMNDVTNPARVSKVVSGNR
jgi:hypothetical protein